LKNGLKVNEGVKLEEDDVMKMSFYEWITFNKKVNSYFGKLSKDIREDSTAPQRAETLKEWKEYLKSKNCCNGAMQVLEEAWAIYWDQVHREAYSNY